MARLVCIFSRCSAGENYGVAAVETGGKQLSTGQLHFIFESATMQKPEMAKSHFGFLVQVARLELAASCSQKTLGTFF